MFSVCKFIEREHQYYIHTRKMPGFLSRKLITFLTRENAGRHDCQRSLRGNLFKGHTRTTYISFKKSCPLFRRKCRRFFGGKYHRFFRHKNTGSPSCQCSVCVSLSKGSTSTTYTPEKCLDFSQGS